MTQPPTLAEQAAEAMRANGRIPETRVLEVLPDVVLREIIAFNTEPRYVS